MWICKIACLIKIILKFSEQKSHGFVMVHGCFEVCEVLLIAMNPCYKKLHGKTEKFMKKTCEKRLDFKFSFAYNQRRAQCTTNFQKDNNLVKKI